MLVLPILQAVDDVLKPVTEALTNQCRACPYEDACCNLLVGLTYLEARDIVTYLLETKQWGQVREKLNAQRHAIRRIGDYLHDPHRNGPQSVVWKWFLRGQKCALYDTQKRRCKVYEVRPLSCRELFADLGTRCDKGESDTTNLAQHHAMELIRLTMEYIDNDEKLVGELAALVWQAWQDMHRESAKGEKA